MNDISSNYSFGVINVNSSNGFTEIFNYSSSGIFNATLDKLFPLKFNIFKFVLREEGMSYKLHLLQSPLLSRSESIQFAVAYLLIRISSNYIYRFFKNMSI